MQNVTNDEIAINSVKSKYSPQLMTNETVTEYFRYLVKLKLLLIILITKSRIVASVKIHMLNLKKALKSIFNIVKNAEFVWIFGTILAIQNNVKNAVNKIKIMYRTIFFINSNIFIVNSSLTYELYIK